MVKHGGPQDSRTQALPGCLTFISNAYFFTISNSLRIERLTHRAQLWLLPFNRVMHAEKNIDLNLVLVVAALHFNSQCHDPAIADKTCSAAVGS